MKNLTAITFCGVMLGACADDYPALDKGIVDTEKLGGVVLDGDIGTIDVPMLQPVPDVPADSLASELSYAVSLMVMNPSTGTSADLSAGILVDDPRAPSEFAWSVNSARDVVTMRFFNEVNGLKLRSGVVYEAILSIGINDYIQRISAVTFDVPVN